MDAAAVSGAAVSGAAAARGDTLGEWAVRWHPVPQAEVRLFCVPHTGGGAAVFRAWAKRLAPAIEILAIRLPGREARFRAAPLARLHDLVPALVDDIEPLLDRPHAWFGHSLGALIAFESCRLLRARSLAEPLRLMVSGHPAPHLPPSRRPLHDAPDEVIIARLRELGGTPREVLDDRVALSALLPMLRADFALSETYRCQPTLPLDCPITVFGGWDDPFASVDQLRAWDRHSASGCELRMFHGGHFFINDALDELLSLIRLDLLNPRETQ
jgi:medium-chain acyl-[acyl-carrier-protein] hydrolase